MSHEIARAQLTKLGIGLSQDASLTVEVGDGPASFDPRRRVITVSPRDLEERGLDLTSGLIGHEVGHAVLSRYHEFEVEFPSAAALATLLNGIEDPRVNYWVCLRFPGVGPWLRALIADITARSQPGASLTSFLAFCLGSAAEPVWDAALPPLALPLTPRARAALAATRAARVAYARTVPPTTLTDIALQPDLRRRFHEEVVPRLRRSPGPAPPPVEMGVLLNALEALRIAEVAILPAAARLLRADIAQVDELLQREPRLVATAERAVGGRDDDAVGFIVRAATGLGERASPFAARHAPLASTIVERYLTACTPPAESRGAARHPGKPARGRGRRRGPRAAAVAAAAASPTQSYDEALADVSGQLVQLTRSLEAVLRPRRRQRLRAGFSSGARVELRRAVAAARDPRQLDRLWLRRTVPDRRHAAVLLLIDCSGSMRGDKARAAVAGATLTVESLSRLEVATGVLGFQDEIIPFLPLGERLTAAARAAIGEIPLEIEGTRTGPAAHGSPSYNDDGPCLRVAAAQLLAYPATDRLLVVVSDGVPEGRHSGEADLHRAVAELTRPEVPLTLFGIGLGRGTGHMRSFYPNCVCDVPVDRFAAEVGALLRRVLIGK